MRAAFLLQSKLNLTQTLANPRAMDLPNTITATFHFLTGPLRTVDVTVTLSLPQPPAGVFTYTLTNGFTIN